MDKRVESLRADVLALEGEDANTIREAVRLTRGRAHLTAPGFQQPQKRKPRASGLKG
jgi:hypothetical protein